MVMNFGVFVLWLILFERVYRVNCQCVTRCRFDVWRLLIMHVESVHDYGNYMSRLLAGMPLSLAAGPPSSPSCQIDSLHNKANIFLSYGPRKYVSYFAVCRITGFLLLLQSDGALYLDLSVLLHLFLILLWQCRRKRRIIGSSLLPVTQLQEL